VTVLGVDVSVYQPKVNWPQLRSDGRVFMYARCCDGLVLDGMHEQHLQGAASAGIAGGSYQFGHPSMDVAALVKFFLLYCDASVLRPCIDMESLSNGQVPTNAGQWADTWCELVKQALHVEPVIYASTSYWQMMKALCPTVGGWDWWAAEYRGDNNPNDPPPTGCVAWQFAGNVPLSGQAGLWDLDVVPGDSFDALRV
jgi:lysozyme